jgi:Flp pilus assembly protein TadD
MDTLAVILLDGNEVSEALTLLQTATTRRPGDRRLMEHYATALARSGDEKRARQLFENLLATGGDWPGRSNVEAELKRLRPAGGMP